MSWIKREKEAKIVRARNLKPGFFKNEYLLSLSPLHRILFAGLWCIADRNGILEDRPLKIKIEILPSDDCDVDIMLNELENADGLIKRYIIENKKYIKIEKFSKHQNPYTNEVALHPILPESYSLLQQVVTKHTSVGLSPVSSLLSPVSFLPSSLESLESNDSKDSTSKNARARTGKNEKSANTRPSVAPLATLANIENSSLDLANEEKSETPQSPTKSKTKRKGSASPPVVKKYNSYSDDFELFWQSYPRQVVKSAAGKCFEKLVKQEKIDPELLITCAKNYADYTEGKEPQYILHPATFLSIGQRRWEDFINPLVEKKTVQKFGKKANAWFELLKDIEEKEKIAVEDIDESQYIIEGELS